MRVARPSGGRLRPRETDHMPQPRTQFRVGKTLYTAIEGLRKEYERHRFLHHQDARRVKSETIMQTLAEHAGLVPKPTDADELERHLTVMRLVHEQRDKYPTDAPPRTTHPASSARSGA